MEILLPLLIFGGGYYVIENNKKRKLDKIKKNKYYEEEEEDANKEGFAQFNTHDDTMKFEDQTRYENNASLGNKVGNVIYNKNNNINLNENNYDGPIAKDNVIPYLMPEMTHMNMNPLNGGKPKGAFYGVDVSESIFDNKIGNISQQKEFLRGSQPPLFAPQKDISFAHGFPDTTDFQQERQYVSSINNNFLPFVPQQVGPALGKGYTTEGCCGFNSGLDARDLYMPKNVDELRTISNPKVSYNIQDFEGAGNSYVKNPTEISQFGLNNYDTKRMDSTHFLKPDEVGNISNVGLMAPQLLPDLVELGNVKTQNASWDGTPGLGASYGNYIQSHPNDIRRNPDLNPSAQYLAPNRSANTLTENPISERTKQQREEYSIFDTFGIGAKSMVSSFIAPITDVLRPTKKTDMIENGRIFGSISSGGYSSYARNLNDTGRSAMKQNNLTPIEMMIGTNSSDQGTLNSTYTIPTYQKFENTKRGSQTNWFAPAEINLVSNSVENYSAEFIQPSKATGLKSTEPFFGGMSANLYAPVLGQNTRNKI